MSDSVTAAAVPASTQTETQGSEEQVPLALRSGKGLKAGLGAFDKIKAETPGAAPKAAEAGEAKLTGKEEKVTEPTKAEKKAYKVKFGDREVVFDDDEKIQRTLQKAYGAEQRFEEAAKARAEAAEVMGFLEDLKRDPTLIRHLVGEDGLRKLAVSKANEFFTREQEEGKLSPEAREYKRQAEQHAAQLEQYRQQELRAAQEQQAAQQKAEIDAARETIGTTAAHVLESLKIPAEATHLKGAIARKLVPYLQANLLREEPLDPQGVAADYLDDTKTEFAQLAGSLEGEQLVSWLGEAVANKIRLYDLGRLNGGPQAQASTPREPQPAKLELPKTSDRLDPIERITRMARGY